MTQQLHVCAVTAILTLAGVAPSVAQDEPSWPSIEEATAGLETLPGFFPLYWDDEAGRLWLEIGRLGDEVLYVNSLATGVGSNDLGLDRGQIGGTRIVAFERVGSRVLMVQPNYGYRATSDNPDEQRAVEEAFARSVLWGFEMTARTDDRVLVDATSFLLRDAHGVIEALPGRYRLEPERSAVYRPRTKAFPENTEMEATLTFVREATGEGRGFGRGSVGAVTPSPEAVTVRQHHSLVQLPDDGYVPRRYDPRSGFGFVSYVDYAAPLGADMTTRYVRRHRLERVNPGAERGPAVEPIVYYLDRGTPEPVRSALLDGARWWSQAFEAAGYEDAFRVEMLPEGADSLDVRYNVIQWVHRSTRGWSYGNSVTDPRTGEIIKGHVTLGSLRVRQDYLIAEGLTAPYDEAGLLVPELSEMALARIRQLSAHEVGHTIGLGHNYYASREGRISVMDYPHPLVTVNQDGQVDLSDAYAVGIGAWDRVAIDFGYRDYPVGRDEGDASLAILDEAWDRDLRYLTGRDTAAHPRVHIWANGTDPARELTRMMHVRRTALDRFGETVVQTGRPLATLEEALVPLYLHHRYQVEATASALGGLDYVYAFRGDGRTPVTRVAAALQRDALMALAATLSAEELEVPADVIDLLPPRPSGWAGHRELFPRTTGPAFDVLSPPRVAATVTLSAVLDAARAARLVEQQVLDPDQLGLDEVLATLTEAVLAGPSGGYRGAIARTTQRVLAERMMALARDASLGDVRALTRVALTDLADALVDGRTPAERAHRRLLAREIDAFLAEPPESPAPPLPAVPPGSPIGDPAMAWLLAHEGWCEWER